jgi:hypothetical protein
MFVLMLLQLPIAIPPCLLSLSLEEEKQLRRHSCSLDLVVVVVKEGKKLQKNLSNLNLYKSRPKTCTKTKKCQTMGVFYETN